MICQRIGLCAAVGLLLQPVALLAGQASAESVTASRDAAVAKAAKAQVDRLAILMTEYNTVSKELAAEQNAKAPDPATVTRLQSNLNALSREIEVAKRTPVPVVSLNPIAPKAAQSTPASVAPATPQSPAREEANAAPASYESWDIFRNFGRKERKAQ